MADRYWIGGASVWTSAATALWSASPLVQFTASCSGTTLTTSGSPALVVGMTVRSSGGLSLGTITGGSGNSWTVSTGGTYASQTMVAATGGASVPTASDNVFFTQPGTYPISLTGALTCNDFTVSAGTITLQSGTTPTLAISGSMSLVAGTVWSSTAPITFNATTTGKTVTTNGTSLFGAVTFNGAGGGWTLGSALTVNSASQCSVLQGTLDTAGFAVSFPGVGGFSISGTLTRQLILNNSTFNVSGSFNVSTTTNLTFSPGTSQINLSGTTSNINGSSAVTFYNVSFINPARTSNTIEGPFVFNNLSFTGVTTIGVALVSIWSNPTINGTLTLSAGTSAAYRTNMVGGLSGNTVTLTVAAFAAGSADYDFQNIIIVGAASPISGTRFGDRKNNSGITFPAAKTVYYRSALSNNWGAAGATWSFTNGGFLDSTAFPLAQDTAVFPSSATPYPSSGNTVTINANYAIGTIDMSARTTNTMTLATGTTSPTIYGNWINGTGVTLSGTGTLTFAGRGSQTITSAGVTFTQLITVNSPSGTVTLQDAMTNTASGNAIGLTAGTFSAASYNVTLANAKFSYTGTVARTLDFGSGTWTFGSSGLAWSYSGSNLTVTGTGTISLTNAGAKTFTGGGIQTYPTLNQGGTGALTINGSNKFAGMTNTAIGSVLFAGGTTNEFTTFDLNGAAGNLLTLGSTTTTQAILKKPGAWNVGANSTDGGNNTGLSFI